MPDYLAEVLVATTWECNLECSYCFVHQRGLSSGGGRMQPDLASHVVDALDKGLSDVEVINIHFYGGEPLLNLPAIEAMVRRAGEKPSGRFRFSVTTNGTCGSAKAIELLKAGKFQVILSIDGPAPVHDSCRLNREGKPTHHNVRKFLRDVKAKGCWVRGSAVVRSGWSLAQAGAYLRSLNVDAIKAQAVRLPEGSPFNLSDAEKQLYMNDLEAVGSQVIKELDAGLTPVDDRFSSRVLQLLKGTNRESFCGAGKTSFGVSPDGTVLPCILLDHEANRLGSIMSGRCDWRAAGIAWRNDAGNSPKCSGCKAHALCGGGCRALMPFCGDGECDIIRKNCEIAAQIYERFKTRPEKLLALAGIT